MSHHQGDYMADEYKMEDVDDLDEEFHDREMGGPESEVDVYDYLVCALTYETCTCKFQQFLWFFIILTNTKIGLYLFDSFSSLCGHCRFSSKLQTYFYLDWRISENDYLDLMQNSKTADTCSAQARRGKDIQGIPWERLTITREKYRQTRVEQYKNYENIPRSGDGSAKVKSLHLSFWFPLFPCWYYQNLNLTHFSMVNRNAKLPRKGDCFMSSNTMQDLWNQQFFISRLISKFASYYLFANFFFSIFF